MSDGTGSITAVFTGRRKIIGVEHGRTVILEGVAVPERDGMVIFNPAYTLVAPPGAVSAQRARRVASTSAVGPTFNGGSPRSTSHALVAAAVSARGRVARPAALARDAGPGHERGALRVGGHQRQPDSRFSRAAAPTSTNRASTPFGVIVARNSSIGAHGPTASNAPATPDSAQTTMN